MGMDSDLGSLPMGRRVSCSVVWLKVEEEVHLLCVFMEAEVGWMADILGKSIS